MVYRCKREEEFGGCGWVTVHYDEVDAHEEQLEPGHWVLGKVEQVDLLPVAPRKADEQVASEQVEQVDLLAAVPEQAEQAGEQAESKQVEQALAQADDEVNRELNQICVCGAVLWSVECRKRGHLRGPQPRDMGAERFGLIGSNETDHGPDGFPL